MIKKSRIIVAIFAVLFSGAIILFAAFSPIAMMRTGLARALYPMMRFAISMSNYIGSGGRESSFSSCDSCDGDRVARIVGETKLAQAV